jgi:hypothetical protein
MGGETFGESERRLIAWHKPTLPSIGPGVKLF